MTNYVLVKEKKVFIMLDPKRRELELEIQCPTEIWYQVFLYLNALDCIKFR